MCALVTGCINAGTFIEFNWENYIEQCYPYYRTSFLFYVACKPNSDACTDLIEINFNAKSGEKFFLHFSYMFNVYQFKNINYIAIMYQNKKYIFCTDIISSKYTANFIFLCTKSENVKKVNKNEFYIKKIYR